MPQALTWNMGTTGKMASRADMHIELDAISTVHGEIFGDIRPASTMVVDGGSSATGGGADLIAYIASIDFVMADVDR